MRRVAMALTLTFGLLSLFASCRSSSVSQSFSGKVYLTNVPTGSANVVFDETKHISVRLDAYGFEPTRVYSVRIHAGTCLAPAKAAPIVVGNVRSDGKGVVATGVAAEKPAPGSLPVPGSLTIEDSAAGRNEISQLTCSDIPKQRTTTAVRLFAPPGHKPGGTIDVRSGGDLTLSFNLLALPPGSAHAVRLLNGTCQAPGGAAGQIDAVTANAQGSVKVTRKAEGVKSPRPTLLSIAINDSSSPDSRAILCGDVQATASPSPR